MTLRRIQKKIAGPEPLISQNQIDRYFDEANVNGDQYVSAGELMLFLGRKKFLNEDVDYQKAVAIIKEFDADKNGGLDRQEFTMLFRRLLPHRVNDTF